MRIQSNKHTPLYTHTQNMHTFITNTHTHTVNKYKQTNQTYLNKTAQT